MMLLTERELMACMSPLMSPSKPFRIPHGSQPKWMAMRTTARTQALYPGLSPPLVRTPIRRILDMVYLSLLSGPAGAT